MARQGSGSACRSLFGGYVAWEMGKKADGTDSRADLIAPKEHWPEMRAAILVASAHKKDVSSTSGMQTTVATSSLFKERITNVVPERFQLMKRPFWTRISRRLPNSLCVIPTNSMRSVLIHIPHFYMNDTSRAAIHVVEEINKHAGHTIAAYTFDAGPNCVIYFLEENSAKVLGPLKSVIGSLPGWDNAKSIAPYLPAEFERDGLKSLLKVSLVSSSPRLVTVLKEQHLAH